MPNDSFLFQRLFKHWTYRIFAPGAVLRETYEAFKKLLRHDTVCHDLMAEFEEMYHQGRREDFTRITYQYERFSDAVSGMIANLDRMKPGSYQSLNDYFRKFDFYIRFLLAPPKVDFGPPFLLQLNTVDSSAELVGSKTRNLIDLKKISGVQVPEGFVITVNSFNYLLEYNNLRRPINDLLTQVTIYSPESLQDVSALLMSFVRKVKIPADIEKDILSAFDRMKNESGKVVRVAVRSSAVSEDSDQSFAGQYRTVLGVKREGIIEAYKEVLASKYTPEALYYRITCGLWDEEAPMAVMVLKMIDPEISGVVYTVDPAENDKDDQMIIHAVSGLGELLVSGGTTPDIFHVDRKKKQITNKLPGAQEMKMVMFGRDKGPVLVACDKKGFVLTDGQVLELAGLSLDIEQQFGSPQDIEWCWDGKKFFVLQSRSLHKNPPEKKKTGKPVKPGHKVLFKGGVTASTGVASGNVYVVTGQRDLDHIPESSILVARDIPPAYVRVMNRLAAVVADRGSKAGHFATVCREFGVPLLVGTGNATKLLAHERTVTVDANDQKVYAGRVDELISTGETGVIDLKIPYFRKLKAMLDFITPLKLIDPRADNFIPQSCRSMHDIIRFVHEKGVQSMFGIGDRIGSRTRGAVKLVSPLPLDVYVLDVGGGLPADLVPGKNVTMDQIVCIPLIALWKGLSHDGIRWGSRSHFDWKTFDDIVMAGGIARKESVDFASYAVIGHDYLNLNMRFGYHFAIIDTLCGSTAEENYCLLRFAGGGGNFNGRSLRVAFLVKILEKIGFQIDYKGDLLDARIADVGAEILADRLDMVGRLLGATKLMDMALRDENQVEGYARDFFNGRYNFVGENEV